MQGGSGTDQQSRYRVFHTTISPMYKGELLIWISTECFLVYKAKPVAHIQQPFPSSALALVVYTIHEKSAIIHLLLNIHIQTAAHKIMH